MTTLYDAIAADEQGSAALASARLRRSTVRLLHRALKQSNLSQAELGRKLGIRRSAVNQVFKGDGNVRLETLAEYLHGMGFEADLLMAPIGELRRATVEGRAPRYTRKPVVSQRRATRAVEFVSEFSTIVETEHGVGPVSMVAFSRYNPAHFLAPLEFERTFHVSDGKQINRVSTPVEAQVGQPANARAVITTAWGE